MVACAVPEAYGHAATRGGTSVAASPDVATDNRKPGWQEIIHRCPGKRRRVIHCDHLTGLAMGMKNPLGDLLFFLLTVGASVSIGTSLAADHCLAMRLDFDQKSVKWSDLPLSRLKRDPYILWWKLMVRRCFMPMQTARPRS